MWQWKMEFGSHSHKILLTPAGPHLHTYGREEAYGAEEQLAHLLL